MAFISASSIADTKRGMCNYRRGPGISNRKYIVVGSGSCGKDKKGIERRAVVVRLSAALAKEARILHGDRLDLLVDKDAKLGLLRRISKGGYAASATGKKRGEIKPGEFYGVTMKFTHYHGMPMFPKYVECENVTISDEGVLFDLPADTIY